MKMIIAILRPEKYEEVKNALKEEGIMGMTFTHVTGRGAQAGIHFTSRTAEFVVDEIDKVKIEIVLESDDDIEKTIDAIRSNACTGHSGDGRIFVLPVEKTYRISDYGRL